MNSYKRKIRQFLSNFTPFYKVFTQGTFVDSSKQEHSTQPQAVSICKRLQSTTFSLCKRMRWFRDHQSL